jgi:hypothetical protein
LADLSFDETRWKRALRDRMARRTQGQKADDGDQDAAWARCHDPLRSIASWSGHGRRRLLALVRKNNGGETCSEEGYARRPAARKGSGGSRAGPIGHLATLRVAARCRPIGIVSPDGVGIRHEDQRARQDRAQHHEHAPPRPCACRTRIGRDRQPSRADVRTLHRRGRAFAASEPGGQAPAVSPAQDARRVAIG